MAADAMHRPTPTEHNSACGEDEDTVSMALTATDRLMRRCGVRPGEVGVLHCWVYTLHARLHGRYRMKPQ